MRSILLSLILSVSTSSSAFCLDKSRDHDPLSDARLLDTMTDTRETIGRVEKVAIKDVGLTLKARIDTGAGITSLHASIVAVEPISKKSSVERIVFEVEDEMGGRKRLEREIVRWINIKRKGATGYIRRPVVLLSLCMGDVTVQGEVNLAKRGKFLYPLLIGRNILKTGGFLVDARLKFTQHPSCK